jgi:hypothetical protein
VTLHDYSMKRAGPKGQHTETIIAQARANSPVTSVL